MQSGEEVALAGPGTLKAELNTSTRKWSFGSSGWENPGQPSLFITEAASDWPYLLKSSAVFRNPLVKGSPTGFLSCGNSFGGGDRGERRALSRRLKPEIRVFAHLWT